MLGEQTLSGNVLTRRRRITGSLAAFLALTLSGCSGGSGSFQDAIDKAKNGPSVTAAPAPIGPEDTATTVTTQEQIAVTTTSTTLPAAPPNRSPSSQPEAQIVVPEAAKDQERLPQVERTMLAEATKFAGIANPDINLYVNDRFSTEVADFVLVSVEESKFAISNEQLKSTIEKVESITAKKVSFSSQLALSPDTTTDITYDVTPADQITPSKRDTHYIFTGSSHAALHRLVEPYDASSLGDSAFSLKLPYKNLNLTFVANHPAGTLRDGVPANISDLAIELFQTMGRTNISEASEMSLDKLRPDMSHIQIPNQAQLSPGQKYQAQKEVIAEAGQEIWANSYGFAVAARSAGMSYQAYREKASAIFMRTNKLKPLKAFYIVLGQTQYESLPVLSEAR